MKKSMGTLKFIKNQSKSYMEGCVDKKGKKG
jgi:hypothetical protein